MTFGALPTARRCARRQEYLVAKRAVEAELRSSDAIRAAMFRPSLIWSWTKRPGLCCCEKRGARSHGLCFVSNPFVQLNSLVLWDPRWIPLLGLVNPGSSSFCSPPRRAEDTLSVADSPTSLIQSRLHSDRTTSSVGFIELTDSTCSRVICSGLMCSL